MVSGQPQEEKDILVVRETVEQADSKLACPVSACCLDCACIFLFYQNGGCTSECPRCSKSLRLVKFNIFDDVYEVTPEVADHAVQEVVAHVEKGDEKKYQVSKGDAYWKGKIISRTMVVAMLRETLSTLKDTSESELDLQKLRFTEDSKRCLGDCVEHFLLAFYHSGALCAEHRDRDTPTQKDFALAQRLRDPALFEESLNQQLHGAPAPKRRRLRPCSDIPDIWEES
eukprot:Skav213737  [mRNA]  locus=scaffold2563:380336:381827:+ [translate_table: standard]